MTTVNGANASQGFNMFELALVDFNALDGATISTQYSFLSDGGHDIVLQGSGFTYSGNNPTGGSVTGGWIDLNDDLSPEQDIIFSNIPNGNLQTMTNGGASGNVVGFWGEMLDGSDDVITGSAFADNLKGLGGDDQINGGAGNDTLEGGAGNDTLTGGAGNDLLNGGSGNDFLIDDAGADTLNGGAGDDYIQVNSAIAADVFDGGAGNDVIDWSQVSTSGVYTFNLAAGTAEEGGFTETMVNFENLYGTDFNDHITGTSGANYLKGLGGDDTIIGGAGADSLYGGDGDDYIIPGGDEDYSDGGDGVDTIDLSTTAVGANINLAAGTANFPGFYTETILNFENVVATQGDDTIRGTDRDNQIFAGFGDDRAEGGGGNDLLKGGPGRDTLLGGDGADTLGGSNGSDLLRGESGADLLLGSNGNDRLFGGTGADTLLGGNGNDTLWGGAGADRLVGGSGIDTASYSEASAGVWVRLWAGDGLAGEALGDELLEIEHVVGSAFDDTLGGDNGNNRLDGGAGNDALNGGGGDDQLIGGAGNDTLTGGAGNDTFLYFAAAGGADRITDFTAGAGTDDAIRLFGFGAAVDSFAEVMALASQVGADTVINFGGGDSITLVNVNMAQLHQDDFIFG